ncbi:MAG: hypothetical protein HUJ80_09630, partial [Firmicutes bacterium]|nr:hypothetical protein [Bacillota bacterium]
MTFILLLGLMPITILPVFAEETPLRALTVGETAIADAAQEQSGEGWSYDGNGTLTLNDATIQSGITATGDLSIVLFGTNKVTISSNGSAINSSNKLTLSGSGSLEAEALGYGSGIFAQDLEIKDCTVIAKGTFGINANNTLTIDNSVLTLAGNSGQGASASNVIIKDGSDVTTTGNYGINALRDLTVDSSEITATGTIYGISAFGIDIKGSKVTSTGNGFHGIFVTRDATIYNSEVTATGKDGSGISSSGLEIKGGSKVYTIGSTNGISLTKPLIVEDSELNAIGSNIGINGSRKMELKNSKVNATCEGTFALWVTGPLTIDNCEVVASGQGGINASGITITDSSVSATGSSDYGISNPSYVVNLVRSDLTAKGATYGIHAGTVEVADDSTLTAAGATSGLYYAKLKTEFTVLESSSTDGSDPTWGTDYSEGATTSAKFVFVTPSTVRCGIGTDDEAPASYSDPCTFAEAMAAANEAGGGTFYMQLISDTVCGTAPIFTGPQPAILDLNGYVLDLNGKNITLAAGADLTITDSDSQKPHCFDSSTAPWIPIDNSSENTETVRGGVITGGIATHGGAIYVSNDAFLTLQGGNIAGNKAEENGGAVNNQGTCRMTGGSIA